MEKLLQSSTIQFEKKDIVLAAFEDFRKGSMDFADCLIGHVHRSLGCEPTATFDTALRKLPTFQML